MPASCDSVLSAPWYVRRTSSGLRKHASAAAELSASPAALKYGRSFTATTRKRKWTAISSAHETLVWPAMKLTITTSSSFCTMIARRK